MKFFIAFFVLLSTEFTFSQFSRTYFQVTPTRNTFSSFAFVDGLNQQNLIALGYGTSTDVRLITQKIDASGEVTSALNQTYSLGQTIGENRQFILGVTETQSDRYYILGAGNTTVMNIIWIKVNKQSGTLVNSLVSSDMYRTGYFEAKLIGNDLVCYAVKNGVGLVRVSTDTNSFSAPSEEIVDASVSVSVGQWNTFNGYKNTMLYVINGVEKVICASGGTNTKLFTRNAANNYMNSVTGIATNRSVSSFLINPTTIGITNGAAIEHYNAAGTLIASGTFSSNSIWPINKVTYTNNEYHIFTKSLGTEIPTTFIEQTLRLL